MDFPEYWQQLLKASEDAKGEPILTPHNHTKYTITDVQDIRIIVTEVASEDAFPLQQDTFRKLLENIDAEAGEFPLQRLPPGAERYAAVQSLHPAIEIDEDADSIIQTDPPSPSMLESDVKSDPSDSELSVVDAVHRDATLVVTVLDDHADSFQDASTQELVDVYALLSDLKSEVDELRREVSHHLLDRVDEDAEAAGERGRVIRKTRFHKELKDESYVRSKLSEHGINIESVRGFDTRKLRDTLRESEIPESEFFEIEERDYIQKVALDSEMKTAWLAEYDTVSVQPETTTDGTIQEPEFERGSDLL